MSQSNYLIAADQDAVAIDPTSLQVLIQSLTAAVSNVLIASTITTK